MQRHVLCVFYTVFGRHVLRGGYLRTVVHADFRENIDWQDCHTGSGIDGYDRHGQKQDPRQGGHSARATAAYICWEAAGRGTDTGGLQYPEGIDTAFGSPAAGWCVIMICYL